MTYLPQPWCSKDPRPTIKAVGLAEILISVCGLIILVSLPLLLLQLDHEINYIQQHHHGIQSVQQSSFSDPLKQFYTLNVTDNYLFSCDVVLLSLQNFLDGYLNKTYYYNLSLNRTVVVNRLDADGKPTLPRYICEVHLHTKTSPTVVIYKYHNDTADIERSFRDIVVECVVKFNGDAPNVIEDRIGIISPYRDEISKQKIYPVPIGDDPERRACINEEMNGVDNDQVLKTELNMYKLLGFSAVFALIGGFVLTSAAFTMSRFALMITFLMEIISVFLMAGGLVVLNSPLLCLYQYGGISAYSVDTPTSMQTIITYSCAVYMASFKLYLIWNAMAFAEVIPIMKAEPWDKVSQKMYQDYVAEVAEEVAKRNRKLAEGGKWSDEEDEGSDYSDDSGHDHESQWSDMRSMLFSTPSTAASLRSKGPEKGIVRKPGAVGPTVRVIGDYGSSSTGASGRSTSATSASGTSRMQSSRASFTGSSRSGHSGGGRFGNKGKIFEPTNTLVSQNRDRKFLDSSYFGH